MGVISLLAFFALFQLLVSYSPEQTENFYKSCPPIDCGKLGPIRLPFTNKTLPECCGPFVVKGCDKEVQEIQLEKGKGRWYEIESISQANTIFITDTKFRQQLDSRQCQSFNNLSVPIREYAPFRITPNLTLFKCNHTANFTPYPYFDFNYTECKSFIIYYNYMNRTLPNPPPNCSIIQLPLKINQNYDDIFHLLTARFSIEIFWWTECYLCQVIYRGRCQRYDKEKLSCVDANGKRIPEHGERTKRHRGLAWKLILLIASGILMMAVWYLSRKFTSNNLFFCWKKKANDSRSIDAFLKNHGPMPLKTYRYTEVKKMTQCFKDKLGQGGYGGVFKGKLPDGRFVAVKVLKESKSDGEEFVNEVASISRTSHVNIVTLLGFCYEGSKRALIYEFMSNGSLEKYIYNQNSLKANFELGWQTLYEIAIGVAQGLEYLHRGCNTRILHFDIKPHNILLDEKLCPKISDFGLAKICPTRESIISMMGARGTVGYIAPEVFCRNFGGVSHKSDVYSYGMLVLEMVGGRRNVCVEVDNTSEIYFPDWIYKRLEVGEELGLRGINNEEENQMARKMMLVSLWCIQTNPANRPPMGRVVEMLQGSFVSLQIPPRPYLSSPSRSLSQPVDNSSTTTSFIV